MSNSVHSDNTSYFETQACENLPGQLRNVFHLDVFEVDGHPAGGRKFLPGDAPPWSPSLSKEAEVDFFAHCRHTAHIPVLNNFSLDGHVYFTTSPITARATSPSVTATARLPKSAEKVTTLGTSVDHGQAMSRYLVAEVLYGGKSALIPKKAIQLEAGLRIAFLKTYGIDYTLTMGDQSVLDCVDMALVVHQLQKAADFFNHVSRTTYPLLSIIKDAGRLVFVHNTLVPTKVIRLLQEQNISQAEELEKHATVIQTTHDELVTTKEELEETKEKLHAMTMQVEQIARALHTFGINVSASEPSAPTD